MVKMFSNGMIDAWRRRIAWITLNEAIILLRHLGDFETDKIVVHAPAGFYTVPVQNLLEHFSPTEYCINIRPVYFTGGPVGEKQYKGTLVTLLLDRILLISHEKGCAFALKMVTYARSYGEPGNVERSLTSNFTYCI